MDFLFRETLSDHLIVLDKNEKPRLTAYFAARTSGHLYIHSPSQLQVFPWAYTSNSRFTKQQKSNNEANNRKIQTRSFIFFSTKSDICFELHIMLLHAAIICNPGSTISTLIFEKNNSDSHRHNRFSLTVYVKSPLTTKFCWLMLHLRTFNKSFYIKYSMSILFTTKTVCWKHRVHIYSCGFVWLWNIFNSIRKKKTIKTNRTI